MDAPPASRSRSRDKLLAPSILLIVLATLLVLGRTIGHEFVEWDDPHTLEQNRNFLPPTVKSVGSYWRLIEPPDSGLPKVVNDQYGLWVPLTYSVWGALAAVAQVRDPVGGGVELNPYVFHAANVAIHAASGVLALLLMRRLTGSTPAALGGALLFALHPVQVEPVAWASGTKDLLAGALGLSAALAYLMHADESAPTWRRRVCWYAGTVLFVLGMLAKPSAMTTVAIVGVMDWVILRRSLQSVLLATTPWLLIAVPFAIITRTAQPGVGLDAVPLWAGPLIALDSLAFYLGKLVWPVNLAFDYGRPPARVLAGEAIRWTWVIPVAVLAIAAGAARRGHRFPLAALAIFVLAPLPVLGLTPFMFQYFSTTADHYLYVAMLGPGLLLAWAITRRPRAGGALAAVVVLACAGTSFRQAGFWRDGETLFARNVAVSPMGSGALNNLGLIRARQERYDEAVELLRRSVAARPDSINSIQNLRDVLIVMGESDQAMQLLRREMRLKQTLPYFATGAYWVEPNHGGKVLLLLGEHRKAVVFFRWLLERFPHDSESAKLVLLAEQLAAREESSAPATGPAGATSGR